MPFANFRGLGQTTTSPATSPTSPTSPTQTTVPASVPITPGLFGGQTTLPQGAMSPVGFPSPPGSANPYTPTSGSGGGSGGSPSGGGSGGGSPSGGGSGGLPQLQQPQRQQTPGSQILILSPNGGPYGNLRPMAPYGGPYMASGYSGYNGPGGVAPYAGPYGRSSAYGASAGGSGGTLTRQLGTTIKQYWPWLLGGAVVLLLMNSRAGEASHARS